MPSDDAAGLDTITVRSPATNAVCGEVRVQTSAEVRATIGRARAAQAAWAQQPFAQRARALRRLGRALARDELLVEMLSAESGKPRFEAEAIELLYLLELTRLLSGRAGRRAVADDARQPWLFRHKRARVRYHPRGVVGVIGPWNWPLLNNFADAVPALLTGNAVVLKPSPLAPLTSMRVAEVWRSLELADVLHVVTGGTETARALIDGSDMVFFTGSRSAGREVASRAGDRLVPAVVELGGKSAMIVLADADLPRAARAAVWSGFANCGQVCIRTERIFVERAVADAFLQLVADRVRALRQGHGDEVDIGPVRQASHLLYLEQQIDDALGRGAHLVTGGHRRADLGDNFFAPTVLSNCDADMAVMSAETFGPVLPIMTVETADDAVRLANRPPGGLSGSIWSRDVGRARTLARQLQTGSVCINDALVDYLCVEAPLGPAHPSGLGFRHGPEALRQFCRMQTIIEDRPLCGRVSSFVGRQISFPYQPRVRRLLRSLLRWD